MPKLLGTPDLPNLPRFIFDWTKNTPILEEDVERLERKRKQNSAWNKANPEKIRESARTWYKANPEYSWRKANPERDRANSKSLRKKYTKQNLLALGMPPDGKCPCCSDQPQSGLDFIHYCGNEGKEGDLTFLVQDTKKPSPEAIAERAKGGWACKRCHHSYDRSWALTNPQSPESWAEFVKVVRQVQAENLGLTRAQLSKPLQKRLKQLRDR